MLEIGTYVRIVNDVGWIPEPTPISTIIIDSEGITYNLFGCGAVRFKEEALEVVE